MAKKLNISFKATAADMIVYQEIISHTDKSAFVKEAIQYYLNNYKNIPTQLPSQSKNKSVGNRNTNEILNILG
jgi:hypothetical protein